MAKAEIKTVANKASVAKYIASIEDEKQRKDCKEIAKLMKEKTKSNPVMWGDSLVGFGKVEMTYASGRKVDWMRMGFAPRKGKISVYLTCNLDQMEDELKDLGKHKRGVGCLYIKSLDDIDMKVFKKMLTKAMKLDY